MRFGVWGGPTAVDTAPPWEKQKQKLIQERLARLADEARASAKVAVEEKRKQKLIRERLARASAKVAVAEKEAAKLSAKASLSANAAAAMAATDGDAKLDYIRETRKAAEALLEQYQEANGAPRAKTTAKKSTKTGKTTTKNISTISARRKTVDVEKEMVEAEGRDDYATTHRVSDSRSSNPWDPLGWAAKLIQGSSWEESVEELIQGSSWEESVEEDDLTWESFEESQSGEWEESTTSGHQADKAREEAKVVKVAKAKQAKKAKTGQAAKKESTVQLAKTSKTDKSAKPSKTFKKAPTDENDRLVEEMLEKLARKAKLVDQEETKTSKSTGKSAKTSKAEKSAKCTSKTVKKAKEDKSNRLAEEKFDMLARKATLEESRLKKELEELKKELKKELESIDGSTTKSTKCVAPEASARDRRSSETSANKGKADSSSQRTPAVALSSLDSLQTPSVKSSEKENRASLGEKEAEWNRHMAEAKMKKKKARNGSEAKVQFSKKARAKADEDEAKATAKFSAKAAAMPAATDGDAKLDSIRETRKAAEDLLEQYKEASGSITTKSTNTTTVKKSAKKPAKKTAKTMGETTAKTTAEKTAKMTVEATTGKTVKVASTKKKAKTANNEKNAQAAELTSQKDDVKEETVEAEGRSDDALVHFNSSVQSSNGWNPIGWVVNLVECGGREDAVLDDDFTQGSLTESQNDERQEPMTSEPRVDEAEEAKVSKVSKKSKLAKVAKAKKTKTAKTGKAAEKESTVESAKTTKTDKSANKPKSTKEVAKASKTDKSVKAPKTAIKAKGDDRLAEEKLKILARKSRIAAHKAEESRLERELEELQEEDKLAEEKLDTLSRKAKLVAQKAQKSRLENEIAMLTHKAKLMAHKVEESQLQRESKKLNQELEIIEKSATKSTKCVASEASARDRRRSETSAIKGGEDSSSQLTPAALSSLDSLQTGSVKSSEKKNRASLGERGSTPENVCKVKPTAEPAKDVSKVDQTAKPVDKTVKPAVPSPRPKPDGGRPIQTKAASKPKAVNESSQTSVRPVQRKVAPKTKAVGICTQTSFGTFATNKPERTTNEVVPKATTKGSEKATENVSLVTASKQSENHPKSERMTTKVAPKATTKRSENVFIECIHEMKEDVDEASALSSFSFSDYADCKDIYALFHSIKMKNKKSRTRIELDFYSHLKDVMTERGRYLTVSDHQKISNFVADFEYLRTRAQSVNEEESDFLMGLFEGLIQESKKQLRCRGR